MRHALGCYASDFCGSVAGKVIVDGRWNVW
jgi:hypothetical protein